MLIALTYMQWKLVKIFFLQLFFRMNDILDCNEEVEDFLQNEYLARPTFPSSGGVCNAYGCKEYFPKFNKYMNHWSAIHVAIKSLSKCLICGVLFIKGSKLRQHYKAKHSLSEVDVIIHMSQTQTEKRTNMFFQDPGVGVVPYRLQTLQERVEESREKRRQAAKIARKIEAQAAVKTTERITLVSGQETCRDFYVNFEQNGTTMERRKNRKIHGKDSIFNFQTEQSFEQDWNNKIPQ